MCVCVRAYACFVFVAGEIENRESHVRGDMSGLITEKAMGTADRENAVNGPTRRASEQAKAPLL